MKQIHKDIVEILETLLRSRGINSAEIGFIYDNIKVDICIQPEIKRDDYFDPANRRISWRFLDPVNEVSRSGILYVIGNNVDISEYSKDFPNWQISARKKPFGFMTDKPTKVIVQKDAILLNNWKEIESILIDRSNVEYK